MDIFELKLNAELGDAEAQFNLGAAYLYGNFVPKSSSEAVKWWRMSAEQGYSAAQFGISRGSGLS